MARKQMTTRKKVKVIGTDTYIKQSTGELKEMQVVSVEERDFNFHKVWLQHILNSIDLIGNQKTKLAFWIVEHLNKENQLIMTQRQIAEKTNMSLDTVRLTIKALLESDFLERINIGAYRINPNVIFKGNRSDRLSILIEYTNTKGEQIAKEMEQTKKQAKENGEENESDARTDTTSTADKPI